jgi:tetratricopeptide (TPR) repeat protein
MVNDELKTKAYSYFKSGYFKLKYHYHDGAFKTIDITKADLKGSIENYSHGLQIFPNVASAHFYRGIGKYYLGEVDDAIKDIVIAIKILPSYEAAKDFLRSIT